LLWSNDTENNEEDKDEEIDLAPKLSLRLMLRCWSANIRARHDLGGALIAHEQLWTPVCCCNLFSVVFHECAATSHVTHHEEMLAVECGRVF